MLGVESRGSASLLDLDRFRDPWAYRLRVKRPGSDESRDTQVDLVETFNWLLGLRVSRLEAPRRYAAEFGDNEHGRLKVRGALREDAAGAWRVQAVEGTLPDESRALVIWRNLPGDGDEDDENGGEGIEKPGGRERSDPHTPTAGIDKDNAVLDAWFEQRGYARDGSGAAAAFVPDLVFVNGDCNLQSVRPPDAAWEVQLIEDRFLRLMFETEGLE